MMFPSGVRLTTIPLPSDCRDLEHRMPHIVIGAVLQQEILPQPGTDMEVSSTGHSTDVIREQAGSIDHESGLQDPFTSFHAPATGR